MPPIFRTPSPPVRVFEKSGASVFEMPRSARHDKGHSERNPCHSESQARNLHQLEAFSEHPRSELTALETLVAPMRAGDAELTRRYHEALFESDLRCFPSHAQ